MAARPPALPRRSRERGSIMIETLIALVLIALMVLMVARALDGTQRRSLRARSAVAQTSAHRRLALAYATTTYTTLPADNVVVPGFLIDSTWIAVTGATRQDALGRIPRLRAVFTDNRPGAGSDPDTLWFEFSPYLTRQTGFNLTDLRP